MAQLAGEAIRIAAPARPTAAAPLAVSAGRARLALVAVVFALVAILAFVDVSQTSVLSAAGYQVGTLESARDYWKLRNDQLDLEIAEARSLATVEREAKRLGMGPPARVIYLPAPTAPQPSVEPGSQTPVEPTWPEDLLARLHAPW
jgi:Zn-dependent protease with chaperone function